MGHGNKRVKLCVLSLLFVAVSVSVIARPQPDYTLWGTAYVNGVPLTQKHTGYVIRVEVDGTELVRYTMGSVQSYGDHYVLKVPMDDDPSCTQKGHAGDIAHIFINDSAVDDLPAVLGGYGKTVQRDLHATILVHETGLDVSPAALDFGEVFIGSFSSLSLRISNTGSADLCITSIELGEGCSGDFLITSLPAYMTLKPGDAVCVELSYYPLEEGGDRGTLEIVTDDEEISGIKVPISGAGIY
jgi:hypothetical protein